MTELSERYRRLLRLYPQDHRSEHEEEMLGVLLAGARPGQTRPSLREAFDLVCGGLQIRAGRAFAAAAGEKWRDALAVVGVLGALLMSVNAVRLGFVWLWAVSEGRDSFTHAYPDWYAWAMWPMVAVLALLGARRAATVTAAGALVLWAAIVVQDYLSNDATAAIVAVWWPLLGLVAVAGLAVAPGPRHGVRVLLRNKPLLAAVAVLMAAAIITVGVPDWTYENVPVSYLDLVVFGVALPAGVVAGVIAISSAVGRRVLVLLSAPAAAYLLLRQTHGGGPWSNYSPAELLPVVPLAFAVFVIGALSLGAAERRLRLAGRGD